MDMDVGRQQHAVHNFPSELLCIIFTYVADEEPVAGTKYIVEDRGMNQTRVEALGWLRLSEVCARFRAVLLSMAELWARIVFELPLELGKLALARSQSMPLPAQIEGSYRHRSQYDWVDFSDPEREQLHEIAAQVSSRLCLLSIKNPSIVACKKIMSAQLPQMEELCLDISGTCPVDPFKEDDKIHVNAPLVRLFQFTCIIDSIYHQFSQAFAFQFPALLSLKVETSRNNRLGTQELSWVADILWTSPLLEYFHFVVYAYDLIGWSLLFDSRTITFPHLKSLELRGNPALNVLELYRHIGSPRPSRCIVSCCQPGSWNDIANEAEHILDFTRTFSAFFPHASHDGLGIEVDNDDDDEYRMLTLRMAPRFEDPRQHVDWRRLQMLADVVEMTVGLAPPYDDSFHTQVVGIIVKALQGNRIKQLSVSSPSLAIWPDATKALLSACPAVTELVVDHHRDMERMFTDFPLPIFMHLPALDSVFFKPQIAHGYFDEEAEEIDPADVLRSMEGCARWLAARASIGRRVRRLCVFGERDDGREMCAWMAAFVDEYADEREEWS